MVIDIHRQFAKLCPHEAEGLSLEQQFAIVDRRLKGCRAAGDRGHWSYDVNDHIALIELRAALVAASAQRRAA